MMGFQKESPLVQGNSSVLSDLNQWSEDFRDSFQVNIRDVDARNPAPRGMYKNPTNNGIFYISTGAGFLSKIATKSSTKF